MVIYLGKSVNPPSHAIEINENTLKGLQAFSDYSGIIPPSFCAPPKFNWKPSASIIFLISVANKLHYFHYFLVRDRNISTPRRQGICFNRLSSEDVCTDDL